MTMHRKLKVLIFFNTCPEREIVRKKNQFWPFFCLYCLHLLFYPKKWINYNNISLPWALAFFYQRTSFASPTAKHVGPCQWIMQTLKYVFWGPWTPWSLCYFFPWCKLKRSRDEFNNQLHILQSLGMASWSMVYTTPSYEIVSKHHSKLYPLSL